MQTIICLIRHGQTDWNKQLIIQGRLNNPLNEVGISQAHETGILLKEKDPNWDIIYSSPLDRAKTTAQIIASEIGYTGDIIIDNDLIEREFGEAEGEDIEPVIYDRIERDDIVGMETRKELQTRAYNTIIKIAKANIGKKVLITSHSHFIKGLMTLLDSEFTFFHGKINNAALNYFVVVDDKIISYELNVK